MSLFKNINLPNTGDNRQDLLQYTVELERRLRHYLRNINITSIILGLANSRLVSTDASGNLNSVSNLATWIAGTLNQITVTNDGDGTITLSLPQNINTDADVEFDSLILDDLTATRLTSTDGSKKIVSVTDLTNWIAGTLNQITVTNDGDGTVTLSLPQNIDTSADVEFDSIILDDLTASRMVYADASKKLQSIANLSSWIAGTTNQIIVTNDGDGTITLSLANKLVTTKTTTSTLTELEQGLIICNSASDITINLPTAIGNSGLTYSITNINTGIVTIDANGSQTIHTDLTFDLYQDENIQITSNNSNWYIS